MTTPSIDLHQGDAIELLAAMPAESVSLIFADPPFNIGMKYDTCDDGRSEGEYLGWARAWVDAAVRTLSPTGSMVVMISDEYAPHYHLMLSDAGLTWRNTIVWHYTFGPHLKKKFGRDHCQLLYFVRDPKRFTFNADAIRIPSARQRSGDKRANPLGRVPGDVWTIPRLPGNARERTGHPCQTPQAILERVILAMSSPGDTVLDPFAGSGTTLAVAKRWGRNAIGIEMSEAYCHEIRRRLEAVS